jgi:hypothetical protein
MAVVTRYTAGYPQVTPAAGFGFQNNQWLQSRATVRAFAFNIAATNGDSINSVYKLGRVPSGAILLPESLLYCPAIAGLTSVSVGLDNLAGTAQAGCLMSAVNISAGGSFAIMAAVAVANYNQKAYQLLGLSADPNSNLDVYATLNAAATASGAIAGFLKYIDIGA